VICRFRPVNQRELREYIDEEKAKTQIRFVGDTTVEIVSPGKETLTFTFDRVNAVILVIYLFGIRNPLKTLQTF
jgi:hypothetical protein